MKFDNLIQFWTQQCDQIRQFLKSLGDKKFLQKKPKHLVLLALFYKGRYLSEQNLHVYFLVIFGKIYFTIWSHCERPFFEIRLRDMVTCCRLVKSNSIGGIQGYIAGFISIAKFNTPR